MTQLSELHPGMVEEVISMLRHMEIDGETMQHIIESVGLEDQMTRQLMFSADRGYVEDLWDEIVELERSHD
jgi:ABC-type histidine transport system ATPase subunit